MSSLSLRSRTAGLCVSLTACAATAQPVDETPETIVVTGTRLGRTAEQAFQQVRAYERARIEASGQSTLADFLATVPEVSINSLESTYGATSVRLRGAREGSTIDSGMVFKSKKPIRAAPPVDACVRRPLIRMSVEPSRAPRNRTEVAP